MRNSQDIPQVPALASSATGDGGEALCARCGGSGVVDDGEIDCYTNGEPFANGPIKCFKDCPACMPLGLVERLRNGGQPDLADMAQGLLTNLQFAVKLLEAMPFIRGTAQVDAMNAAIAKATRRSP